MMDICRQQMNGQNAVLKKYNASFSCRWLFCRQSCSDDGCRPPAGGLSQLHHQPAVSLAVLQTRNTSAQLWLAPIRYSQNYSNKVYSFNSYCKIVVFSLHFPCFSFWLHSTSYPQCFNPAAALFSVHWCSEILGALLSVFTIWLVTGVLVYLAVERLVSNDYDIEGTVMLITSGCAVLANIM